MSGDGCGRSGSRTGSTEKRVPGSHALTRHYIEELGLPLRPFVTSNPEAYYHLYRQGGTQHREEGDFVLCTLPFPVLRTLDVPQGFSGRKQRAIRQLQYESATKVLAVTDRRFWESDDGIYGGSSFTDLPSQATVYPSDNVEARDPMVSGSPGVLLAAFTWGAAARFVDGIPVGSRADFQLNQVAKIHPQLNDPGMVRESVAWSWDEHPWTRGGFALPAPGQRSLLRDAAAPEGRVYFAGEHCSLNHGWIQGALESAVVAVRDMLGETHG